MWICLSVVAKVLVVELVTLVHVPGTNVLLLRLGHGGFLVHAATELISSVPLGPISKVKVN